MMEPLRFIVAGIVIGICLHFVIKGAIVSALDQHATSLKPIEVELEELVKGIKDMASFLESIDTHLDTIETQVISIEDDVSRDEN
jgi:t-SNARE complex subunit (syntaxin)